MKPTKTNKNETLMKKILDRIFGFELLLAECKTKDDYEEQKMIFNRGLGYRSWPLIAVVSIGFGLLFTFPNSLEDISIGITVLYSSLIMGFVVVCFELARRRAVAICEQRINELSMHHVGRKGQIQDMDVFENDKSHYNKVVVAPAGAGMSFYLSQNPENIDTTRGAMTRRLPFDGMVFDAKSAININPKDLIIDYCKPIGDKLTPEQREHYKNVSEEAKKELLYRIDEDDDAHSSSEVIVVAPSGESTIMKDDGISKEQK